jgi:hypothetical protein
MSDFIIEPVQPAAPPPLEIAFVPREAFARVTVGGVAVDIPVPWSPPPVVPPVVPPPPPLVVSLGASASSAEVGESVTLTAAVSGGVPPYATTFYRSGVAVGGPVAGAAPSVVVEPQAGENVYVATVADVASIVSATAEVTGVLPPEPELPEGRVAATLADMLALEDLEVGEEVTLQGYAAPGDGGGGVFVVYDGGAVPDGGTVFAPDSQVSEETEALWTFNSDLYTVPVPAGQNIVWGSAEIDLVNPAGGGSVMRTIPGTMLHGHRWTNRLARERRLNVFNNSLRDTHRLLYNYFNRQLGDGRAGQVRIRYRHTTGGLRLVRQGVTNTLNLRWFGGRTHAEDAAFNNVHVLAHMANVAMDRNAVVPGQITTLLVPRVGGAATTYEYFGSFFLPSGVTLAGDAGAELVDATTTLVDVAHGQPDGEVVVNEWLRYVVDGEDVTFHYQPVRERADAVRLRVKSGEALKHVFMLRAAGAFGHVPEDTEFLLGLRPTAFYLQPGSTFGGLRDIVLDGNYLGQEVFFQSGGLTSAERKTHVQDSPSWAGFVTTNHNAVPIPVGQQVHVTRAAVVGYGNTCVLGQINAEWTGHTVLLGESVWNHDFYWASGTWTHVTFRGFSWTQIISAWTVFNNLVFEDGRSVPSWGRSAHDLLNVRGADDWDASTVDHSSLVRSDGTVPNLRTHVNGYFLDFRGSALSAPSNGIGYNLQFRDGVVVTREEGNAAGPLFYRNANNPKAMYPDNLIQDCTVFATCPTGERLWGAAYLGRSAVRDVRVVSARAAGVGLCNVAALAQINAGGSTNPSWQNPKQVVFERVDMRDAASQFVLSGNILTSATEATEYYFLDCHVRNTSNTLFRGPAGTGVFSTLSKPTASLLKLFFRDSSFRIVGSYYQNTEIFFRLGYFDGCEDAASGRTSEDSGVFTMPSAGSVALIPTALLWEPHATGGTVSVTPSAGSVASTSWTDAAGAPLGANKRGPYLRVQMASSVAAGTTLAWSAAVRPWPPGTVVPATPS